MEEPKLNKDEQSRKEYRIMPITVKEYQIAQLWSVAEASILQTGGGEGVEVIAKEPYEKHDGEKGQYAHKIYHVQSNIPRIVRMLGPNGLLEIDEKTCNTYPLVKTVQSNRSHMKDRFYIDVQSLYLDDLGESENIHNLSSEEWKNRNGLY